MFPTKSWFTRWFGKRPAHAAKRQSFRPSVETLEDRTVPTTFTVTNTANSGAGSLRQAILNANSTSGLDTIVFRIGNSPATLIQPKSIRPTSQLPRFDDPIIVDGTVPFGTNTLSHVIEIDGSSMPSGLVAQGLMLGSSANGSTIKGLVINGFNNFSGAFGIQIEGNQNTIQNNRIGTSINGNSAKGNQIGIRLAGSPSNNLIGGPLAGQGNLLSGNRVGILLTGSGTSNTVQGNFIGTNAAGTGPLGNADGISIGSASTTVVGNVISANTFSGINLERSLSGITNIKGNKIGTAADGVSPLGNARFGVFLFNGAQNTTIGGTNAGDGNIIAFNSTANILIGSDSTQTGNLAIPAGSGNKVLENINFRSPIEIHLGDVNAGPLNNDPLDADTGPNNFQNFPVLTSALPGATTTSLTISLASTPNRSFRIEIFSFSGTVNGQHADLTFRGFVNVNTDAAGNAAATTTVNGVFPFVALTATDLATGDTSIDAGFSTNTPPMIQGDVLTPEINEGQQATLSGQLVDPNVGDKLTLRVNWGDGTIRDYHPGLDPFAFKHRYDDDGVYDVIFTWSDNHGGSKTRTRQVVVHNVAPELRNLDLSPDDPNVHQRIVLSGRIADPGDDTFTLTVAWGDGTVETIERGHDGEFRLKHRYRHAGQFTIHLTVTDDDGGITSKTMTIDVG